MSGEFINSPLVCRLCIKLAESFHPIDYVRKTLESILPNLDLSLTNDPIVVCSNCVTLTTQCHTFISMCLEKNKIIHDNYYKLNCTPVDLELLVKNSKNLIKPNKFENTCDWTIDYTCTVTVEKNEQNHFKATKEYQDQPSKPINIKKENTGQESTVTVNKNHQNNLKTQKKHQDLLAKSSIKNENMYQEFESSDIIEIFESDIISDSESDILEDTTFENFKNKIVSPVKNTKTEETKEDDSILITDSENDDFDDYDMEFVEEFDFNRVQNLLTVNTDNVDTTEEVNQSSPPEGNLLDVPKSQQLQKKNSVFSCLICHRNFSQKLHLNGHLLNKHKDIPNVENLVTNKIHYCHKCPFRTVSTTNLYQHLVNKHNKFRIFNNNKTFFCAHCQYFTKNKGNLITHLRIHTELKSFSCEYCHKSFTQNSQKKKHILRRHEDIAFFNETNEFVKTKIFACNQCPYKTLVHRDYLKHSKKHYSSGKKRGRPRKCIEKAF